MQGLSVYRVTVRHNSRDRGELVTVAAPDETRARLIATESVRSRHSFPTSVALFAEVSQ